MIIWSTLNKYLINKSKSTRSRTSRKRPPFASSMDATFKIPPFQSNTRGRTKLRFKNVSGSAINAIILPANIIGALGGICSTTNSTVACFTGTYKIRSIKVWAPCATQGVEVTAYINWLGTSTFSVNNEVSDTTALSSAYAYVSSKPPKQSQNAWWQQTSTNPSCQLGVPIQGTVEIDVDWIMCDGETSQTFATVTTATLGALYYLYLDGSTIHALQPISRVTTF